LKVKIEIGMSTSKLFRLRSRVINYNKYCNFIEKKRKIFNNRFYFDLHFYNQEHFDIDWINTSGYEHYKIEYNNYVLFTINDDYKSICFWKYDILNAFDNVNLYLNEKYFKVHVFLTYEINKKIRKMKNEKSEKYWTNYVLTQKTDLKNIY
jgi:hypothetical protein